MPVLRFGVFVLAMATEAGSAAGGLSFIDLLSLADQGDTRAAKALETMAHYLGRGMRMIVAAFVSRHSIQIIPLLIMLKETVALQGRIICAILTRNGLGL